MSVIQYIYPRNCRKLAFSDLLIGFQEAIAGIMIAELKRNSHSTPDWRSFFISHPGSPSTKSLFCIVANSAANKRNLSARYSHSPHLPFTRLARCLIWGQLKVPLSLSEKKFNRAFDNHYLLIAALLRQCDGIIDLPENEKLYTSVGFARHAFRIRHNN